MWEEKRIRKVNVYDDRWPEKYVHAVACVCIFSCKKDFYASQKIDTFEVAGSSNFIHLLSPSRPEENCATGEYWYGGCLYSNLVSEKGSS